MAKLSMPKLAASETPTTKACWITRSPRMLINQYIIASIGNGLPSRMQTTPVRHYKHNRYWPSKVVQANGTESRQKQTFCRPRALPLLCQLLPSPVVTSATNRATKQFLALWYWHQYVRQPAKSSPIRQKDECRANCHTTFVPPRKLTMEEPRTSSLVKEDHSQLNHSAAETKQVASPQSSHVSSPKSCPADGTITAADIETPVDNKTRDVAFCPKVT